MADVRSPRHRFRVLSRTRSGYDSAVLYDVQLQVGETGALVWSQTFTDDVQAHKFQSELEADLDDLLLDEFRRKYGVPAST